MRPLLCSLALIAACNRAPEEPAAEVSTPPPVPVRAELPAVGEPAPALELVDFDGDAVALADVCGRVPIVLVFGSFT